MNTKPIKPKASDKTSIDNILSAFRRKLADSLRKETENLKCPLTHIDTLMFIAEKGTPSMKEISSHLNITPPSTTVIIEAMQKKKLVKRVSNEKDRRTIRVELTSSAWGFLTSTTVKCKFFPACFQICQNQTKMNSSEYYQY